MIRHGPTLKLFSTVRCAQRGTGLVLQSKSECSAAVSSFHSNDLNQSKPKLAKSKGFCYKYQIGAELANKCSNPHHFGREFWRFLAAPNNFLIRI
jgi:hypothetical protein